MLLLPCARTCDSPGTGRKGCKRAAYHTSGLADEAPGIPREPPMQDRDDVIGREGLQELHFAIPGEACQAIRPRQIALAIDLADGTGRNGAALGREKEGIVVLDLDQRVPMAGAQHVE